MWKEIEHMCRNMTLSACLGILMITLWANQARAIPPEINIPEDALKRQLLPAYQKPVDARIEWWKDMLINARKSSEVIAARKGLMTDFELYKSERYQSYFAWATVKNFKDLLAGQGYNANDSMVQEKQINIALAFADMANRQTVPALDVMIASQNNGLRYLGWKGYQSISEQIIKGGQKATDPFVQTLADAMQAEKSPAILKKIFQVMETSCNTQSVSAIVLRDIKGKILDAFEKAWPAWRAKVQEGTDAEMIDTIGEAVTSMVSIATSKPSDLKGNERTKMLQMILNQAYTASVTYDKALQAGKDKFANITNEKVRDRQIEENMALQQACSQLLLSCEDGLGKISGDKKTPIQAALNAEVAKGAAVRGSVLDWASTLKKQGVKDPVPAATTTPAKPTTTKPAGT